MSDKNQKTYVDGLWIREKKFDDGSSILKVSVLVDKFSEFVNKHKKTDGFVNVVISAKRNPDEKSSHYAYLDTFVPKSSAPQTSTPKAKTSVVPKQRVAPAPAVENSETTDF